MKKWCPKCEKEWPDDYTGCPNCGAGLVPHEGQSGIDIGNANAINKLDYTDDHSSHDSNNTTNSNNATNSNNTTNSHNTTNNNTTIIHEATKSNADKLNEDLFSYRLKCKELFEDGFLSSNAESQLREHQIRLNLSNEQCEPIKEEIKLQSKKKKKTMTAVGLTDIHQTKSIIEQNTTSALHRQLDKLEAWMKEYDQDSLKQVYYQLSSLLEPIRYTNRYEDSSKEDYWESYWAYVAYMLQKRETQANAVLASLGRWHNYYPEQNDIVLSLIGDIMQNVELEDVKQLRAHLHSNYTIDLQLIIDAIDELLQKDWVSEFVNITSIHSFYIETLFTDFVTTQKENGKKELATQREKERIDRETNNKKNTFISHYKTTGGLIDKALTLSGVELEQFEEWKLDDEVFNSSLRKVDVILDEQKAQEAQRIESLKNAFLQQYESNKGSVDNALDLCRIQRIQFDEWINSDYDFKMRIKAVDDKLDATKRKEELFIAELKEQFLSYYETNSCDLQKTCSDLNLSPDTIKKWRNSDNAFENRVTYIKRGHDRVLLKKALIKIGVGLIVIAILGVVAYAIKSKHDYNEAERVRLINEKVKEDTIQMQHMALLNEFSKAITSINRNAAPEVFKNSLDTIEIKLNKVKEFESTHTAYFEPQLSNLIKEVADSCRAIKSHCNNKATSTTSNVNESKDWISKIKYINSLMERL